MNPNHRSPAHPPFLILLLLALLLPLLVACGAGGAGVAPVPPSSTENAAGASAQVATSAPTAAVAALESAEVTAAPAAGAALREDASAPAPDAAAGAPPVNAPLPTPPPAEGEPRAQGQQAALKAGERDDNDQFAAYLDYLNSYTGPNANIRPLDVSERYLISVRDADQRPLLDARVRIFDGAQQVFEGRTYAGGATLFLPRALGVSANAATLRVVAEQGNSVAETTLTRGGPEQVELALQGAPAPGALKLDLLFLLDATGSMGDEIGKIQDSILSIAERIDASQPRPELRFGLVAYKDRGDNFVARTYDFTPDVNAFRQLLLSVQAQGGGDTPEDLNEGLHQAIQGVSWSDGAVRLAFLVADAAPHLDYQQPYDYLSEAQQAVARGVKLYPIAASNTDAPAEYVMRQLAQQTLASFIFLTYQPNANGGTPGESTTLEAGDSPQGYTVERLDDLVVQIVQRELAAAVGAL